jgi:hypothetical protein
MKRPRIKREIEIDFRARSYQIVASSDEKTNQIIKANR